MDVEKQKTVFKNLHTWFLTNPGLSISEAFAEELGAFHELLHGEVLLQLGNCGSNTWLSTLRYQHKWILSPFLIADKVTFLSPFNQLPLDRNSIDCILAPLTLDAFLNGHDLLDEIDRALKPMGYIVLFGINPISLWGFWLRFSQNNCFAQKLKPHSPLLTERNFIHKGYEICHLTNFYYIPPVQNEKWLQRCQIFNAIGKVISPIPSGFYCLVARKLQFIDHQPILKHQKEDNLAEPVSVFHPACQQKKC